MKTAIVGIDDGIVAADVTVTGSAGVYTVTVPGVLTVDGTSTYRWLCCLGDAGLITA